MTLNVIWENKNENYVGQVEATLENRAGGRAGNRQNNLGRQ